MVLCPPAGATMIGAWTANMLWSFKELYAVVAVMPGWTADLSHHTTSCGMCGATDDVYRTCWWEAGIEANPEQFPPVDGQATYCEQFEEMTCANSAPSAALVLIFQGIVSLPCLAVAGYSLCAMLPHSFGTLGYVIARCELHKSKMYKNGLAAIAAANTLVFLIAVIGGIYGGVEDSDDEGSKGVWYDTNLGGNMAKLVAQFIMIVQLYQPVQVNLRFQKSAYDLKLKMGATAKVANTYEYLENGMLQYLHSKAKGKPGNGAILKKHLGLSDAEITALYNALVEIEDDEELAGFGAKLDNFNKKVAPVLSKAAQKIDG